MSISPGMWALFGCVVVLGVLHAGVCVAVSKLKQRIRELEERLR